MTEYGICIHTLIPLRDNPSEQSEMVSQILFGEPYQIIEKTDKWCKIESQFDQYQGWIDLKLHERVSEQINNDLFTIVNKAFSFILKNEIAMPLIGGSALPANESENFNLGKAAFTSTLKEQPLEPTGKTIVDLAKQYLNAPYLWGGKSILGIDCSGLTQVLYRMIGINIARDASKQITYGNTISFINEAQAGDLAFFDNAEGKITHVGIVINPSEIIHASGFVRIDQLDHQGIYNKELKRYSHKLRVIRRIL